MTKLTALQEMAAYNTLVDEFREILWAHAQGLFNDEIKKAFNQALEDFRQQQVE